MNIGLLAFSTNTGLGYQTLEFYNQMKPHKTLVSDLSQYNRIQTHHERFPDAKISIGVPSNIDMEWLCEDVDVVFVCETPLNYHLFSHAKQIGVKTIQQYNFEFLDYFQHRNWQAPSMLAAPTSWNIKNVSDLGVAPVGMLRVPLEDVEKKTIKSCKTIVHILGRPAVHDRNGTIQFLEAASKMREFKYKVYIQTPRDKRAIEYFEPVKNALEQSKKRLDLDVVYDEQEKENMYKDADLIVIPRKYGGLCLPMNEAIARGIPVIMSNASPNKDILPEEWLASSFSSGEFFAHVNVGINEVDVDSLVGVISKFKDDMYMKQSNDQAKQITQTMSWNKMRDEYRSFFEKVCAM